MYSFPSLKQDTVSPADVVPIPDVITDLDDIWFAAIKN
jgi:hypothetical protein